MWFVLSLISALTVALSDLIVKMHLYNKDAKKVALIRFISTSLFLLPIFPIRINEVLNIKKELIYILIILVPMEGIAFILYSKAINIGELSLVIPITAYSPIIVAIISWILIGEKIPTLGILGIISVTVGSLFVVRQRKKDQELIKHNKKGIIYMTLAVILYGFTTVLGKACVTIMDPFAFSLIYYPIVTVFLAVTVINSLEIKKLLKASIQLHSLISGLLLAISIITHFIAISLSPSSYMIAVKRTSLLFSVIFGHYVLKEEEFKKRLIGSILMLIGITLLVITKK